MTLSLSMHQALQAQMTKERQNAAIYDAADFALRYISWPGSAHYMHESAEEEREHAKKFGKYLIARGVEPEAQALADVAAPSGAPLGEYFSLALKTEQDTTAAINALYAMADEENDPQTCAFLQWFLREQTKSEDELQGILKQISRTDESDLPTLDKRFGKME